MNFHFSGFHTVHLDKKNGSILRDKRVVLGLTQKQVAERAKITLRQYQKFENSERNIMTCSFQMACRIIEALEMNISDFYHIEYITFGALITTMQCHLAKKGREETGTERGSGLFLM